MQLMQCNTSAEIIAHLQTARHVTSLAIIDSSLTSLSGLPTGQLTELHIRNCPNLKSVEGLPEPLVAFSVSNCPAFESLPKLPATLRQLDFSDCPALRAGGSASAFPSVSASSLLTEVRVHNCPLLAEDIGMNCLV